LKRVTVSLDSLDEAVQENDADFPVAEVLNGIDAAVGRGARPIKINMGGEARETRIPSADGALLQGQAATSCASSSA